MRRPLRPEVHVEGRAEVEAADNLEVGVGVGVIVGVEVGARNVVISERADDDQDPRMILILLEAEVGTTSQRKWSW